MTHRMGRHNPPPGPALSDTSMVPSAHRWQLVAVNVGVAALVVVIAWVGVGLIVHANRCAGQEMSGEDRCLVGWKSSETFVPAATAIRPDGSAVGISADEQAHQRRTFGIVILLSVAVLVAIPVWIVVWAVRQRRARAATKGLP